MTKSIHVPSLPHHARLAAAVGMHQTTVSLALRDHPRIHLATRLTILQSAEKLGDRKDPRITEWMHHLRLRRTQEEPRPSDTFPMRRRAIAGIRMAPISSNWKARATGRHNSATGSRNSAQ